MYFRSSGCASTDIDVHILDVVQIRNVKLPITLLLIAPLFQINKMSDYWNSVYQRSILLAKRSAGEKKMADHIFGARFAVALGPLELEKADECF